MSDHHEHLLGLAGHTGENLALDCRRQFLILQLQGSESELMGFPIRFCLLPQNLGNFGLVSEENRLFNFLAKAQPKGQLAFAGNCHLLFDFYFAAEPSRGMRQPLTENHLKTEPYRHTFHRNRMAAGIQQDYFLDRWCSFSRLA